MALISHSQNYLFVKARNHIVERDLQKAYEAEFRPDKLAVFCVDNRDYQDRKNLYAASQSGIRQFRRFCYSVPATAAFQSAQGFLDNLLPSPVLSVQLWLETGTQERSQPLERVLSGTRLREVLAPYRNTTIEPSC